MSDKFGRDPRLRDFKNFLFLVWKALRLPPPTPVQYQIADWLQYGPDRLVVEAFRGVGKSWIAAAFIVWRLYWDPDRKELVVSASKAHADDISTFILQIIRDVPGCAFLSPQGRDRASKVSFDVGPARGAKQPSVKSLGITSQITGSRGDDILSDDIESLNNSMTHTNREKLHVSAKEFEAVLSPGGRIVVLGTPQTQDTLYDQLAEAGYAVRIWPARYPDARLVALWGERLAPEIRKALENDPTLVGKPVDPDRFGDGELSKRELAYGKSDFARQFMLDTSGNDELKYPLKLRDLVVASYGDLAPERIVWTNTPECRIDDLPLYGMGNDRFYSPARDPECKMVPWGPCVMYVDPSGTGADETGYAIVKLVHGFLFCVEATGLPGGYSDSTLTTLATRAKTWGVNLIKVEDNFGDGMFAKLLQPHVQRIYPCGIELVHSVGQKERRIIDTLEPVMNQHRLVVFRGVVEGDKWRDPSLPPEHALRYHLFYQMTRLTAERGCLAHDDRIESLAGAVAHFTAALARDPANAAAASRRAAFDKELREFDRYAIFPWRPKSEERTWIGSNRGLSGRQGRSGR